MNARNMTSSSKGSWLLYLVAIMLVAPLLSSCGQPPSGQNDPTPAPAITSIPTARPTTTGVVGDIWPPTPALMNSVWQPPEPKKKVEPPQPTEVVDSPDALIVYETANIGMSSAFKVTTSGQAVIAGSQDSYTTYQLSQQEFDQLKAQIAAADFFNLQDRYWQEDPPGITVDMGIVTITYKQGGRTKSIAIRGRNQAPIALAEVERTLEILITKTRAQGTPSGRPEPLVSYYLDGSSHHAWWLDVDVNGGLYYGSGPADAHLSPEDLGALKGDLEGISSLGSDEWFSAPDNVRKTIYMSEHRAIITTYISGQQSQSINVLSGATVSKELQAVLDKLAEIYDKYAP